VSTDPAASILVVEDNAEIRLTALAMLRHLGFAGHAVHNGLEAVEAIGHRYYDLIFMDCQMPIMDGYEATRRIRDKERQDGIGQNGRQPMAIVAMTASALAGDRERCLASGMDDYLCKPFTLDTLQDFLIRFLSSDPVPAAPRSKRDEAFGQIPASPAVRSAGPAAAQIDYDALQRIGALGSGSSSDLLSRVVRSYLDAAPPIIDVLRRAVEREDHEAISSAAHRLKGSSAQLGVVRVAALCADLEQLGRDNGNGNGTGEAPAALLGQLEKEFGLAQAALEEEWLKIAS
jgi:CheY-like chemotaxis protein